VSTSCPSGAVLLSFLERVLERGEEALIEEHVSHCADCAERLVGLERLTATLRSARAVPTRSGRGCPDAETLASYADGSMSAQGRDEIEEHLAGCGACLSEVADVWAMGGEEIADAPEAAVSRVLERLDAEGRAAVLEWTAGALSVIRDFAHGLAARAVDAGAEAILATAAVRAVGSGPARLCWSDRGGTRLDCVVELVGGEPRLAGRVSAPDNVVKSVSVCVRGRSGVRGPESLDAHGRFGPWAVESGRNAIVLSGLPGRQEGPVELILEVKRAGAEAD
jgi:hypothetical protein